MKLYAPFCKRDSLNNIFNKVLSLTKYYENNENVLETLSKELLKIQSKYRTLLNMINEEEKNVKSVINLLTKIYIPKNGRSSIYDMFNCYYLKYNIIDFYDQFLNYFSIISEKMGFYIILCSIVSFIGIFFLISSIMRNSKDAYKLFLKERNKEMNAGIELLDI